VALVLAYQLPLAAIIIGGFLTGHGVAAIFVVVGLLALSQVVATVLSIRRSRARAKRP
jgi:hypothetical protein